MWWEHDGNNKNYFDIFYKVVYRYNFLYILRYYKGSTLKAFKRAVRVFFSFLYFFNYFLAFASYFCWLKAQCFFVYFWQAELFFLTNTAYLRVCKLKYRYVCFTSVFYYISIGEIKLTIRKHTLFISHWRLNCYPPSRSCLLCLAVHHFRVIFYIKRTKTIRNMKMLTTKTINMYVESGYTIFFRLLILFSY